MINFNHNSIKFFEKIILSFSYIFDFFKNKKYNKNISLSSCRKKNFKNLANQFKILSKNWKFITPKQFENHINKKVLLKGRNLLVTFDDGFKSNFYVEKNFE